MSDSTIEELRALKERVAELETQTKLPKLMNIPQCAEYLGRSTRWLDLCRKKREQGIDAGPPFLHISARTIRYDIDQVRAWARTHEV